MESNLKVNELRIGNIVKDGKTGELISVFELREEQALYKVIDRSKFPLPMGWYATGIPLTEEILLKAGFSKPYEFSREWSTKYEDINPYSMITIQEFGDGLYYSAGEGLKLSVAIKYFHQLQNLYHALTGQELTINF